MARQWNFDFFVIGVYYEKLGHMLKTLVPKYRPDLTARLKAIAEKQVFAKLKPIVGDGALKNHRGVLAENHVRARHYIVVYVCFVDPPVLTQPATDQRQEGWKTRSCPCHSACWHDCYDREYREPDGLCKVFTKNWDKFLCAATRMCVSLNSCFLVHVKNEACSACSPARKCFLASHQGRKL